MLCQSILAAALGRASCHDTYLRGEETQAQGG